VPLAFPVGLLALALVATSPKAVEPLHLDVCETASSHIELTAASNASSPLVCISPDVPVTFRFNVPLQPDSVRVQERERYEEVNPGQKTLMLVPPKSMVAGERLKLEVCFADDAAPACASFLLVAHPGLGMQQVKVFRQPSPVAYFQEVARELRVEAQRLGEEVRQLRAERAVPEGLRGVVASGLMGEAGIACKILSESVTVAKGNALRLRGVHSCRAEGRVAVVGSFSNSGTTPWTATGAVLRGPKGEVLKPLPLWQPEPILSGQLADERDVEVRVVMEFLATKTDARGTYTLTLWDAERQRPVILENVTFP
jgi:uncharacterized protein (TIGR02268 family)